MGSSVSARDHSASRQRSLRFCLLESCRCVVLSRSLVRHSALSVCSSAFVRAIQSAVAIGRLDTPVPLTPKPVCCITSAVAFQRGGQLLSDPRHFSTSDNSPPSTPPVSDLIWTARHAEPHGKHRRPPHTRWFTECQSAASALHTGNKGRPGRLTDNVMNEIRNLPINFNHSHRHFLRWVMCVRCIRRCGMCYRHYIIN